MKLALTAPTPLEYFAKLVESDEAFPLLEAAVSLAQDEYPELDVQQVLSEVDLLLARLKRRIPADAAPLHRLRMLNQYFFRDLDFGGNVNDYYDPENSYLSSLLRSRRGIPISLAVLWLELAQGLGLNVAGVGFPGHFMVKVRLPLGQVVLDPFTGQSLSEGELLTLLEPFLAPGTPAADAPSQLGPMLRPATAREIIARMLRNLKEIHRAQHDWTRMVAVQDRLLVLLPEAWGELRDRGVAWAELGQTERAMADMQAYLLHAPQASDQAEIQARLVALGSARH